MSLRECRRIRKPRILNWHGSGGILDRERRIDLENADPSAFYAAGLARQEGELIQDALPDDDTQLWAIDHESLDVANPRIIMYAGKLLSPISN